MSTFNNDNSSGLPQGATGPHSSKIANTVDPRVDSDLDHRGNPANTTGGLGSTTGSSGLSSSTHTGTHSSGLGSSTSGAAGAGYGSSGPAPNTKGPHSSDLLNKADPRVDSDNSKNTHTGSSTLGSSTHGTSGLGSSTHGTTGTTGFGSTTGSSNHGPHDSNALNKADPRIDSDRDNRAAHGSSTLGSSTHGTSGLGSSTHGTTGTTGFGSTTGSSNHGPHDSNALNKADPRIDSDRDNRAAHGTSTGLHSGNAGSTGHHSTTSPTTGVSGVDSHNLASTGPAKNTAGPHKSDLLNKLDPRVDSNLDGSKTIGGNKTFETS